MNIEYEVRVLEIDKEQLVNKLEELVATFKRKYEQSCRYIIY